MLASERPDLRGDDAIMLRKFVQAESGATAIEYGLIAAGISVVIVLLVNSIGTQLTTVYTGVNTELAKAGK
jgi:pilus assembly protein Flp/PilA